MCGLFKLTVSVADESWGPEEDESLDDGVGELRAWAAVRAPSEEALCASRWIVLDAGGDGLGWGPSFGGVPLGETALDDDLAGDDMIDAYNQAGFVTVDIAWGCDPDDGTCPEALADWIEDPRQGAAWTASTEATGTLGVSSRALAVYDWVYQNAGNRRLCAHAQSAASGRLVTLLTRFGAEDLFDTVVFDGGPVWGYLPWTCGIDDGDLGERPDASEGSSGGGAPARNLDCMLSGTPPSVACAVSACQQGRPHDGLVLGSNLLADGDFDLSALDLAVVMGGDDSSGAWRQVPLWLGDHGGTAGWPWSTRLRANSVTFRQGLCRPNTDDWRCDWLEEANVLEHHGYGYEPDLAGAPHATSEDPAAAQVMQQLMLGTCELTPDPAE